MISTGLAASFLVTSVALTYFFCLRPMKRGRCAMTSCMPTRAPMGRDAEIAKLREEIEALKRQNVQ